jgi:D-alanine-D-alanine ligase
MLPGRVVVLVNADFESRAEEAGKAGPRAYEADAAVLDTADAITRTMVGLGIACSELRVTHSLDGVLDVLRSSAPDVVFNLVESVDNDYGREWEVPALLEQGGFAYTGNGPLPLKLCRIKDEARGLLLSAGVRVPVAQVVDGPDARALGELAYPVFVKPARVDGSIGVDAQSVCHDAAALRHKLASLAEALPGPFLVEGFLPGKELNVSLFPEPARGHALVTEIDFSPVPAHFPRFVTYDSKWNPESPEYASKSVPAQGSPALLGELENQARRAFLALGGSGYGRVDLRLDAQGVPHVIDVNPNNDLHPDAGLARGAATAGIGFPTLISGILAHAQARRAELARGR